MQIIPNGPLKVADLIGLVLDVKMKARVTLPWSSVKRVKI